MIDRSTLLKSLDASTIAIAEAIDTFPKDLFSLKPTPDSWSAQEVAEHIIIVEGAISRLLVGEIEEGHGRDPLEKVEKIRSTFLNVERRASASEAIQPRGKQQAQAAWVESLKLIRAQIHSCLEELDLAPICKGFKHWYFGEMTRGEWGYFSVYHGKRHLWQMERILTAVSS